MFRLSFHTWLRLLVQPVPVAHRLRALLRSLFRRRSDPRAVPGWAGLPLLAAALLLALAAPARAEVQVSNLGGESDRSQPVGTSSFGDDIVAQGFVTGSHASGYTLTSISVRFRVGWEETPPTVTLHYGAPRGIQVATLTAPSVFPHTNSVATFTAPANTRLHPSATYFIRLQGGVSNSSVNEISVLTTKSDQDPGSEAGWSIRDHYYSSNLGLPFRLGLSSSVQIAVDATPNSMITARFRKVTTPEDAPYTFQAADFDFAGLGSALTHATIVTRPYAGRLSLDGTAVTAGQSVSKTRIVQGDLVFTPGGNQHGTPYSGFTFKLTDGTAASVASATTHLMGIDVTSVNDAPKGKPSILMTDDGRFVTGVTPKVGMFLVADGSAIRDPEGTPERLFGVEPFTYQWIAVEGAIETEIASNRRTHGLSPDDAGKSFKLRVSYTDLEGYSNTVTSDVFPETGTVELRSGANAAPSALDATVTTPEDTAYPFGKSDFNFADSDDADTLRSVKIVTVPSSGALTLDGDPVQAGQWVTDGFIDRRFFAFTPGANAAGSGYASFTFKVSDGVAASASAYTMTIEVSPVNDAATGKPAISGAASVGKTLTARTSGIADVEGLTKARGAEAGHAFSYQWERVDADGSSNPVDISGATSATYTPVLGDDGKRIRVRVRFTDDAGNAEGPLTSDATRSVEAPDATLSGLSLSPGTLSPAFDSARETYTASVADSMSRITVRSTPNQSGATVTYLDGNDMEIADADGDAAGQQVDLEMGANTIKVKVTADDGTTTKTYTVTVTRGTAAADATLSGLTLSPGILSPAFDSARETYAASVANSAARVTVAPTASQSGATVEYLDGDDSAIADADAMTDGQQVGLEAGANTIKVRVTAADRATRKTYTVTVTRAGPPSAALVSNLGQTGAYSSRSISSQAFTTGSNPHGYTLTIVSIDTSLGVTASADISVRLHSTKADGTPGAQLHVLNFVPKFFTGPDRFTASELITLKPNTTYAAVVMNRSGNDTPVPAIGLTDSAAEDSAAAAGWSIANTRHFRNHPLGSWSSSSFLMRIAISGTKNLSPVSTDATLKALTLSAGTLDPVFEPDTESYAASVINGVSRITVTPTVTEAGATVEYLDHRGAALADADPGTGGGLAGLFSGGVSRQSGGHQVDLSEGANTFKVKVTAPDRTTTKTYTVTVTRQAPNDATLRALTLSAGELSPKFVYRTEDYVASVGHGVSRLTVTPTKNEARATVEYLGASDTALADADTGKDGHQVDLETGANTIKVKVTAADRKTTKTYGVTVTRAAAAADATLSGLTLSAGTLDPAFNSATESYTASVANSDAQVTVTPTASQSGATVAFLDGGNAALPDADSNTDGQQVALSVGPNKIRVKVTAPDGTTTRIYQVTVTRAPADDATLSELTLSPGTLWPRFASGTETYTASVTMAVSRVTVTATVNEAGATLEYLDGSDMARADADANAAGQQVDLSPGANTIRVKATAADRRTTKTYTITVVREGSARNALVSNLGEMEGPAAVSPIGGQAFTTGSNPRGYTLKSVSVAVNNIPYITQLVSGEDMGVRLYSTDVDGSPEDALHVLVPPSSYSVGENVFTTTKDIKLDADTTYAVVISNRAGTERPTIRYGKTSSAEETAALPGWSISNGRVWWLSDADGDRWTSIASSVIRMAINGSANTASSDATLSTLELSAGTLSPVFDAATTSYTASVIFSEEEITVTPEAGDAGATVEYLGASDTALADADTDKDGHQVDLETGANTIKVKVTAEDGSTTKTYTVTVTRAAAASTDATLSGLTLSAGTLDPAFASATTAYAASVGNAEDEVTVTPEVAHAGATVEYLGASDTALADADTGKDGHQVALEVGETVVKVKVTAEDGTATYP